jgi:hypothetical protein
MGTYSSNYYVYAYLRKSDHTPYYIGKGKGHRAWAKDHNVRVPDDPKRIIIVEAGLTDIGALAIERRLIRWYGRKDIGTGMLRNVSNGGDGCEGRIQTKQTRKLIGIANSKREWKDESRNKIRAWRKTQTHSPESNKKRSQTLKGRKVNHTWVSCCRCHKSTTLTNYIRWHKDC